LSRIFLVHTYSLYTVLTILYTYVYKAEVLLYTYMYILLYAGTQYYMRNVYLLFRPKLAHPIHVYTSKTHIRFVDRRVQSFVYTFIRHIIIIIIIYLYIYTYYYSIVNVGIYYVILDCEILIYI